MRRWWSRCSVRTRLTLWYAGALATLLALYAGGVFVFLRSSLFAELDRQLAEDFEDAEPRLEVSSAGGMQWRPVEHHDHEDTPVPGRFVEVWSAGGSLLLREPEGDAPALSEVPPGAGGEEPGSLLLGGGDPYRVLTQPYIVQGKPVVIRVGRSEERLRHELGELLVILAGGLVVGVVVAGFGGYALADRALAPVGRMARRAGQITAQDLSERLPVENPNDEPGTLASVFNATLARLEASFEELRRFTADASHELRTPLTAIRSVGEVALRERKGEQAYRDVIGSMLEEAERLTQLVDRLLMLSRADAAGVEVKPGPLDLHAFAQETAEYLGVLADEKGQHIAVEGDRPVYASADPLVLRQALLNVLDNAIKHGPEGACIRLVTARDESHAFLDVVDEGPGIDAEHLSRIFDRFYRADRARSRATGGAGLGLSIARWALQVNGGTLEVESRVGEGSHFRLRLPAAREQGVDQMEGGPVS